MEVPSQLSTDIVVPEHESSIFRSYIHPCMWFWKCQASYQWDKQYTEAKVDVTQEIEQRAQQAAQAGADHCALCYISCVTSTLASVYRNLSLIC